MERLPYVEMQHGNLGWTTKPGTACKAIRGITLKDGTSGFALATGGKLSQSELQTALMLLRQHGEDLQVAVSENKKSFGEGNRTDKPRALHKEIFYSCSKCNKTYDPKNQMWGWFCTHCQHLVCNSCVAKEISFNTMLMLQGPVCDQCGTTLNAADPYIPGTLRIDEIVANISDINARGQSDDTVLIRAARDGQWAYIHSLTQAGADLNAQDAEGKTALHFVLMHCINYFKNFGVLPQTGVNELNRILEYGAKTGIADHKGSTPFKMVQQSENNELMQLIGTYTKAGQDVIRRQNTSQTSSRASVASRDTYGQDNETLNDWVTPLKQNQMASWSMWLGLIGLPLTILFCGVGVILSVPAVILGHKSLKMARTSGAQIGVKGPAETGLVAGYLNIAYVVIIFIWLFFSR